MLEHSGRMGLCQTTSRRRPMGFETEGDWNIGMLYGFLPLYYLDRTYWHSSNGAESGDYSVNPDDYYMFPKPIPVSLQKPRAAADLSRTAYLPVSSIGIVSLFTPQPYCTQTFRYQTTHFSRNPRLRRRISTSGHDHCDGSAGSLVQVDNSVGALARSTCLLSLSSINAKQMDHSASSARKAVSLFTSL